MTLEDAIRHAEEVAEEQEKLYKLCPVTDYGCKGDKHCNSMSYEYDGCLKCAEEHRQLAEWLKDYKRLKEQEPCEDAISRKALISHIENQSREWGEDYDAQQILGDIEDMPSVKPQEQTEEHLHREREQAYMQGYEDASKRFRQELLKGEVEPKTGHWIIIDDCEQFIAKCSECGQIEDSRMIGKYAYCHCGARMFKPQERSE